MMFQITRFPIRWLLICCWISGICFSQETRVSGKIIDASTKKSLDFVKIVFQNTNSIGFSADDGSYEIVCPQQSDTIIVSSFGYQSQKIGIKVFKRQKLNIELVKEMDMLDAVTIAPSGDSPAIRIMKEVIRHKPTNDKDKLAAYQYQVYTKTRMDLINLTDKFKNRKFVKKLNFVLDYVDSSNTKKQTLPVLFSETFSDFYYRKNPLNTKEVVHASKMSGIKDYEINQLYGEVFLDINFYDNYVNMFQRSFLSPISAYGRGIYDYLLLDSAYIDNQFCFLLSFSPKRTEGTTFTGQMWIHDTTFALKEIAATLPSTANINFLHGIDIHQSFEQIDNDVWILKDEKLQIEMQAFSGKKLLNFNVEKTSERSKFKINQELPNSFYEKGSTVDLDKDANNKDAAYWDSIRPTELSKKESGVYTMTDSLNHSPFWKNMIGLSRLLTTGYFPVGYVEIGDMFNFVNTNPVEKIAFSAALRTSNKFSKTIELGGNIGYAFLNERINWGARVRVRVNPLKKWGMVNVFANTNIVQYGQSADLGKLFGSLLKRKEFDKLFYEDKVGVIYEQDLGKNFNILFSAQTRYLNSVGLAKFQRYNLLGEKCDVGRLVTTEFSFTGSWAMKRQYFTAVYERKYIGSQFPILSLNTVLGVRGILGSQNNYQKIELGINQIVGIGVLGRLKYEVTAGKFFGRVPYPFLQLLDGGETYWFSRTSFNKLGYFEYISDAYVTAFFENHFQGLLFNRIPLIKKLKWRLVVNARAAWGTLSPKQDEALIIPEFTKRFGKVPYVETGIGIENIFKFFRVDLVYRATHQIPGESPFGVRFRLEVHI